MARYKDSDRFPTALPRSERQGSCQKECKEFGVWLEMDFDRVLGIAGNLSKLSEVQLNHLHNEINEQTGSLVQAVERHKANGKRIPEVRILDTSIIEDQLAVSIIKKIEECKKVCNPQQK